MRKNLTVSLRPEDWRKVQAMASSLGETYSGVFHRLLQGGVGMVCDRVVVEKYRKLLAPHRDFMARRAAALAKAARRGRAQA